MSTPETQHSNTTARACSRLTIDAFSATNHREDDSDIEIPQEHVLDVSLTERISDSKDKATIVLRNDDGEYTTGITSGTRLRVLWQWSGGLHEWTGLVRDREFVYRSPTRSDLVLTVEDYVGSILGMRLVFNSWTDRHISGDEDGILEEALREEAPHEIDRFDVQASNTRTTLRADGTNLLDLVTTLARRADYVFYSNGMILEFEDYKAKTPKFTISGTDVGGLSNAETDTHLVNSVRVDGSRETMLEDEQTTVTSYERVTSSDRLMFRVDTRKSHIERVEVWTKKDQSSEDFVNVRVQKDNGDGTGPIAPDDATSDIVSRALSHEFIEHEGFTEFELKNETLPEPEPWIIIEGDGDQGHDIGVNDAGRAAFKSYYSYNITVKQTDDDSVDKHHRREKRITADEVNDIKGAVAISREAIDRDATPRDEVSLRAYSHRTTQLTLGDVVTLDFPREDATGPYIVSERDISISGGVIDTDLVLTETSTL